jgi:prephenate dehydratase
MSGMDSPSGGAEPLELWETENRAGCVITVDDKPGQLSHILACMSAHNIDMTSIQSKPPKHTSDQKKTMNFHIDFVGDFKDPNVQQCFSEIKSHTGIEVTEIGSETVPWFPTKIEDFDFIGKRILSEGDGI